MTRCDAQRKVRNDTRFDPVNNTQAEESPLFASRLPQECSQALMFDLRYIAP